MGREVSIINQRFRSMIVTSIHSRTKSSGNRFNCICDCGKSFIRYRASIVAGKSPDCGCGLVKRRRHPDICVNQIIRQYENNAKNRGLNFSLGSDDFKLLIDSPCHYCGSLPSQIKKYNTNTYIYNGIDRLDSSCGYIKTNCVACCFICNKMKMEISVDSFMNHIRRIYEYSVASMGQLS